MKGRKPKPTAIKIAEGNPGKRKLPREPQLPAADALDCPAHLTATARAEWARIFATLDAAGVVRMTDRAALAAYCQSWGDWVDACQALQQASRRKLEGQEAIERYKLQLRIADRAQDTMRRWAVELGLTPSARARIRTDDKRPRTLADELFGSVDGKA